MARRHQSLYLYIGREFLFSFFVSFLFFFFIFFVNQLLLLAEDVLSKHVAFPDVALLVIYSLPAIVAISFPFASLVGALMAVGRMASDSEILALQASGVSVRSIFAPLVVLSLVFSLVSFIMNDYFLPLGTINFGKLYTKVLYQNPQLALDPFSIKYYQNATIVTGAVRQNTVSNLVIFDTTEQKDKRVITAQSAVLSQNVNQPGVVSLELSNVFTETNDLKKTDDFTYSTAGRMTYNILLSDVNVSLHAPTAREMSSLDVYRMIQSKQRQLRQDRAQENARNSYLRFALDDAYRAAARGAVNGQTSPQDISELKQAKQNLDQSLGNPVEDRSLRIDRIELNRKFSVPFACLFFVIFAFPVGLLMGRAGRTVGFGIGLFVAVVYWGLLVAGQTLGYRSDYPPAFSMWFPNLLVLAGGIAVFALRRRR
jgi:lipopolysaccharide export system permease protein